MRRWFFNTGYGLIALVAAPFLLWRLLRRGKRTPALWTKLSGRVDVPARQGPRIWLHAVSVGEVLQVRPLIRELKSHRPDVDIVLSTTTAAGFKLAHEKYSDCTIVPFPFDFTWAVKRAFARIQPDVVALVELELWPNFIEEAQSRTTPIVVANGRLSAKSHRGYARISKIVGPMFSGLSHVFAQNEAYRDRFISLGTSRDAVSVNGSIKFDGLATDRMRPEVQALREAFGFCDSDLVFMAGSTHEPEESIALAAWLKVAESTRNVRLLLVPRHPERFDAIAAMVQNRGHEVVRRSRIDPANDERYSDSAAVRLLDTVGELSACWGLADIAFVGGTLTKRGGQNMLEPAAYACPVLLGPNVWNFSDIAAGLIDAGGAMTVSTEQELADAVALLVASPQARREMGTQAGRYASSQCGAAAATADRIMQMLDWQDSNRSNSSPAKVA